jgi:predicted ArsR family transcriptional regulator
VILVAFNGVIHMSKRLEKWITCLIAGLDENVDEKTIVKVLEECGRQCQSENFVKKAHNIYQKSKNMNEFLDKLGKVYKHLHKEGDNVYIIYPKCYCSFVNKMPPQKLSATYCNCSRGWAKALFEGALGRPVEVVMEESILKGDNQCRFRIIL